jgi:phospholipase/carboxylesterase
MSSHETIDPAFGKALARTGQALIVSLAALESAFRRLHPPDFERIRPQLGPAHDELDDALGGLLALEAPQPLDAFRVEFVASAELARDALAGLVDPPPAAEAAPRALFSMHQHARAQALLYPLRHALPPFSAFFAEPFRRDDLDSLEAREGVTAKVGLFRGGDEDARGGVDLYVPESWDGVETLPLIVALHGGSGNGADFLWTWLREARSRRCLLLAPTSRGSTWSLNAPEIDGRALRESVEWVASNWKVDRERVLLTGLSDGATMTLLVGLGEEVPFTHLAPISGVLHPLSFAIGNLDRARGRKIQLVHGALDWMFPVSLAQEAAQVLEDAGADLVYREIADLSHTYPREENARLIEWLDPGRSASAFSEGGARASVPYANS